MAFVRTATAVSHSTLSICMETTHYNRVQPELPQVWFGLLPFYVTVNNKSNNPLQQLSQSNITSYGDRLQSHKSSPVSIIAVTI